MSKRARKSVGDKTRFEVFKRDSFKCQYCGACAPDVLLRLDHIKPVAKGGPDDVMNYVTACQDCNSGKGARELDDKSVIEKQRRQLEELTERRNQLEMMLRWREGASDLLEGQTDAAIIEIEKHLKPLNWSVSETGERNLREWIRMYGLQHVLTAADVASKKLYGSDPTENRVDRFFNLISKLAGIAKRSEKKPYLKDLYYIRGILRNTLSYVNEWEAFEILERAFLAGIDVDWIRSFAKERNTWTFWRNAMEDKIAGKDE